MPKIQRTKIETQKGDWNNENEGDKTFGRYKDDKIYAEIYQDNR